MPGFENFRARNYESGMNPKETTRGPWERISASALAVLEKERDKDFIQKAKYLMSNPEFINDIKRRWSEQSLSGNINSDPEKQEELWAEGLIRIIKEKLDN